MQRQIAYKILFIQNYFFFLFLIFSQNCTVIFLDNEQMGYIFIPPFLLVRPWYWQISSRKCNTPPKYDVIQLHLLDFCVGRPHRRSRNPYVFRVKSDRNSSFRWNPPVNRFGSFWSFISTG